MAVRICNKILFLIIIIFKCQIALFTRSSQISVKIVNEISNYESNNEAGLNDLGLESNVPLLYGNKRREKVILNPAPFSGPNQFRKLVGTCFSYFDEKYKYKFCPFNNVTQEELQALQEPYKGVLGAWGSWIIHNNSFDGLHFHEGTNCGIGNARNVKISLKCGPISRLDTMNEPSKCLYEGVFETPLVCGRDARLVYPRLPPELQRQWDKIETEKHYEILTQKGYDVELERIFLRAGYLLSDESKRNLSHLVNEQNYKCESALKILEERINRLEEELEGKNSIQHLAEDLESS